MVYLGSFISGFRTLNSGMTTQSGILQPTTHVSPPSAHCWPVAADATDNNNDHGPLNVRLELHSPVPSCPSSGQPHRYMIFPKSCTRPMSCIQSGWPARRKPSAVCSMCSLFGRLESGSLQHRRQFNCYTTHGRMHAAHLLST